MTNLLAWIVFGFVAGLLARFFKPGADNQGWIATIIIGIVGSVIGGFIGKALMGVQVTNNIFSFSSLLFSVIGGIITLFIYYRISSTNKA